MPAPPRTRRSRLLDGALILASATVLPAFVLRTALRPADPRAGAAVVFAPWTDAGEAITRATDAGASLVRQGARPWIVVVRPDGASYVERAFAAGALLVLDPKTLSACAPVLLPPEPNPHG
ncbi:MAG TPA: hypothetical protein VF601_05930 [Beijerinckiaceae bacterium]|jgi:hypothetical protein